MAKFLDNNGLAYVLTKLETLFVKKEDGKGLSTNDYSDTEKQKVANAIPNPQSKQNGQVLTYDSTSQLWKAQTPAPSGVVSVTAKDSTISVDNTDTANPKVSVSSTYKDKIDNAVPNTRKVNGNALSSDVTLYAENIMINNHSSIYNENSVGEAIDDLATSKQATITDLDTIRSGASLGATALQSVPSTYRTASDQDEIDEALADEIEAIEELIPSQASDTNQLADKNFVNSSIGTETAYFRGSYNVVDDLGLTLQATHEQVATALKTEITEVTNNDYAFVFFVNATTSITERYDRYKYSTSDEEWAYEYTLNNSSFTAIQWNTINSGLTSSDKTQIATNTSAIADIQTSYWAKADLVAMTNSDIDEIFA